MTEMATVSAKIPKEMKDKMDELGISPSELFKKAAKREIEEKEWEKTIHKLDEARPILLKTSKEEWVKAIRESRDER
jgi:metal-responsive CopG/Arc/MetJ family transcriptional regulator